ncbi:MAG TPA: ChbG/HpnK family deacetylase [Bacteroides sp.]|nr:ChbG/HpnK family deacetylase [Bacteroides sp.]
MQRITTLLIAVQLLFFCADCRSQHEIRLLVRGDDIGSTHAANLGCIESYRDGIMQSVEIMVPCAWFPEAVAMLRENPDLDVGVHITLTSEWDRVKWRPLTHAPGITDEDGYFYPVIWPGGQFSEERALRSQQWKLEEIEAEMRAQIELALRHLPQISHLTCHMGCSEWDEAVGEVYRGLAVEYGLDIPSAETGLERFPLAEKGDTLEERIANFIGGLNKLEQGHTYLFVEHPAVASPEMEAVGHPGYEDVNEDRDLVRRMFTSDAVKKVIEERHIRLISYADLAE